MTTRFFPSKGATHTTRTETVVAMNGPLDVFYRRFRSERSTFSVKYEPNRLQATETVTAEGTNLVTVRVVPPLADGDELAYREQVFETNRKFKPIDNEAITWSIPFAKRVMRYEFPKDEVPKRIWYETLSNITPIKLSGTKELREPDLLELDITDFQQSTTLRVHWEY